MDKGYEGKLNGDHRERLAWFETHADRLTSWPDPLPDRRTRHKRGRPLATHERGIYKPMGWDHALSIVIRSHNDWKHVPRPGDGWLLSYHQEDDPDHWANAALKRCIQDRIPVGVMLKEPSKYKRSKYTAYKILGLALPVRWYDGYFILESINPPATTQVEDVPADDYDARRRAQRQITQRRGQAEFRTSLIRAYGGQCAITRCDAVEALEAAHIRPYRGAESNVVSNGLPLRSDIHTLYDLDLIAIDPDTYEIALSPRLYSTHYASLAGIRLLDPQQESQRPNRRVLQSRWDDFHAAPRSMAPASDVG